MKTEIKKLIEDFKEKNTTYTQSSRSSLIKFCVDRHGIEAVSEATGYKLSTLVAICNDKKGSVIISDMKVRQMMHVFNNLNVE